MLRRLSLRDFVIVPSLEVEFGAGFTVLTGETGAGKSILIDALQLALGGRGDVGVVREGAARAEIAAEFDTPPSLTGWLEDAGFEPNDTLLLRRTIDAQGKSRAWINGSPATVTQLREAPITLLDVHGQHAWQSLTRPAAVRDLLDAQAGVDVAPLARAVVAVASGACRPRRAHAARPTSSANANAWPGRSARSSAWRRPTASGTALNAEHSAWRHAQALIEAARVRRSRRLSEADANAASLTQKASDALAAVARFDARLAPVLEIVQGAQAQLQDAAHTLSGYLQHTDIDPDRLAAARHAPGRLDRPGAALPPPPEDLAGQLLQWQDELRALAAATDTGSARARAAAGRTRLARRSRASQRRPRARSAQAR